MKNELLIVYNNKVIAQRNFLLSLNHIKFFYLLVCHLPTLLVFVIMLVYLVVLHWIKLLNLIEKYVLVRA